MAVPARVLTQIRWGLVGSFNFVFFQREDIDIFPSFLFNSTLNLVYATDFSPKSRSLCYYTEIFCVYPQFPSSTKSILQNPRGKIRACARDTFRGIWSHRSRRCGGSPHVTNIIIPVNVLELGAMRRRQSQISH